MHAEKQIYVKQRVVVFLIQVATYTGADCSPARVESEINTRIAPVRAVKWWHSGRATSRLKGTWVLATLWNCFATVIQLRGRIILVSYQS